MASVIAGICIPNQYGPVHQFSALIDFAGCVTMVVIGLLNAGMGIPLNPAIQWVFTGVGIGGVALIAMKNIKSPSQKETHYSRE